MSNEITTLVSLKMNRVDRPLIWSSGENNFSQAGVKFVESSGTATTTASALPLGGITSGGIGYLMVQNLGTTTTSKVYILPTTAGIRIAQLDAGEVMLIKCGPDCTTPAISAATTDTQYRTLVFEL